MRNPNDVACKARASARAEPNRDSAPGNDTNTHLPAV